MPLLLRNRYDTVLQILRASENYSFWEHGKVQMSSLRGTFDDSYAVYSYLEALKYPQWYFVHIILNKSQGLFLRNMIQPLASVAAFTEPGGPEEVMIENASRDREVSNSIIIAFIVKHCAFATISGLQKPVLNDRPTDIHGIDVKEFWIARWPHRN